ncbi:hypothetical protein PUN28_019722 [Cardiocondyla obscurior]|uniref:Uncharacterized protein n=1 Tax=Cardiocondyla obscurior TaxID=286306 RepID=A0AAW2EDY1_9HYME
MLKSENALSYKKIRRGKKKKKILTPAFLPPSLENAKENSKPRILQVKEFFGKVKIIPKRKIDEGEKINKPPLASGNREELLEKLQPLKRKEIAVQTIRTTKETGNQAEPSTKEESTQTDKREKYPLHYPGDDRWRPILVTLTSLHISYREHRQSK